MFQQNITFNFVNLLPPKDCRFSYGLCFKAHILHIRIIDANIFIRKMNRYILDVPKHMKRFESLITFDSTKTCRLLFLLINVIYIEMLNCHIST